ncbi:pilus assembly FimT family protein [Duganella qianjiadongensis]|uniref:Type II secretion system protein H n=1 Tax=Duganella qianjiadongensis TaxID=2692176 RepID=A0ABW9VJZ2_9BURK|nr:GspH/FimT family pseudopilin [Duganella qianjiadongensis]MYM39913.1 prepilin-type N-terminal cleavage/methylation domain-containing protein [Duganella qianjiadongensis]
MDRVRQLRRHWRRGAGFTLVELILVIVVVGIMAGVAAPRFFDRKGFDAASYAAQLKTLLRYAQKTAIAQGRPVYVKVTSGGVTLAFDVLYVLGVTAPGGQNSATAATLAFCSGSTRACEAVPAGLTLSGGINFYFDATGKPFMTTDVSPTLTSTFSTLNMTLSGDGSTRTITVNGETGYVR